MPLTIYSDKDLIRRALRNARLNAPGEHLRWAAVAEIFGMGSTYAIELCRDYDLDPHEMLPGRHCEGCNP